MSILRNKGTKDNKFKKRLIAVSLSLAMIIGMTACGSASSVETPEDGNVSENAEAQVTETEDKGEETVKTTDASVAGALDPSDQFTDRDMEQTADLTDAEYFTLADGQDIEITEAGVYSISGTASDVTITIDAGDDDKVQIYLDNANVTNGSEPVIYVKNADKVFVTTASGSENTLKVTGTFTADGDTNTDAVIFAKDDVVINGLGTLNIESTDNGIACKDDIKVTGGTLNITCTSDALEAKDSVRIAGGTINITTSGDGIKAKDKDDDTTGYVYVSGGNITISSGDDGIHATTILQIDGGTFDINAVEGLEATHIQINDGTIRIESSDDGINGSQKCSSMDVEVEINGGDITISMAQGDTDAIDSNGALTITGGTLNITAQSPFDYDGTLTHTGGTIIVNGTETDEITNQFGGMEGGMMGGPGQGGFGKGGFGQGGFGGPQGDNYQDGFEGSQGDGNQDGFGPRGSNGPQGDGSQGGFGDPQGNGNQGGSDDSYGGNNQDIIGDQI